MKFLSWSFLLFVLLACATSPVGRQQLILVPDRQMNQMGDQAFQEMLRKMPRSRDSRVNNYVNCITRALAREVQSPHAPRSWSVAVFKDNSANAFALPGGNIGVHTGMIRLAKTSGQLAAVIGHEIAHVIARHGNERYSQHTATQTATRLISPGDPEGAGGLMAALGLGLQFGVLLPFSRTQESEADRIGLDYMARAGFDPREAVKLWQNMARQSGRRPPEFMSTHPAEATRIRKLQSMMGEALGVYRAARAAGKRPRCGVI